MSQIYIEEVLITEKILENYNYVGDLENKRFRLVLLGVFKKSYDKFWFNPIDSTMLEVGDILLVIGYKVFIREFEKHLYIKDRLS